MKDGKMAQPRRRATGMEKKIAALTMEAKSSMLRAAPHQVDELMINRAGGKLLFNFAVNLAVKRQLVARAGLIDDGSSARWPQPRCRRGTAC